jgi:acylphosphatase
MPEKPEARRWFVSGRVQGVGFRWFVERHATAFGLAGFVRNEDDGRVQVYAVGTPEQLNRLAGKLRTGPPAAEVRGIQEEPAAAKTLRAFKSE